jgi:hypothetical protein
MADTNDPVELARQIAKIASTSTDPDTVRQLGSLMDRLLTEAGLPRLCPQKGDGELGDGCSD